MADLVNVDGFVRAEAARMFGGLLATGGGSTEWTHNRVPTPLDRQTVIRINRDTLYSASIVDISSGAAVAIPDYGDRYVSLMFVNEDHHINAIPREPGQHRNAQEQHETPYACRAVRLFVDLTRHPLPHPSWCTELWRRRSATVVVTTLVSQDTRLLTREA